MSQKYINSVLYPGVTTAQLRVAMEVFIDELKNKILYDDAPMTGILVNSHPGTGKTRLVGLIVRLHYALWMANMNAMATISPIYEHILIACPNEDIRDNFINELRVLFGPTVINEYISFITYSTISQWVNGTKQNVLLIIDEVQELITAAIEIKHVSLYELETMNRESLRLTGKLVFRRIYTMTATPITNSLAQFGPIMGLLTPGIAHIHTDFLSLDNSTATKEMVSAKMNLLLENLRTRGHFRSPFVIHFPADLSVIRYIRGDYMKNLSNPDDLIFNGLRAEGYGLDITSNPNELGTRVTFSPMQELIYRAWLRENPGLRNADSAETLDGNYSNPTQHALGAISIALRLISSSETVRLIKTYSVPTILSYVSSAIGDFTVANLVDVINYFTNPNFHLNTKDLTVEGLKRLAIYEYLDSAKLAMIGRMIIGVPGKKLIHMWQVATTGRSDVFNAFLQMWGLIRYHKRLHQNAFLSGAPRHLRRADGEYMSLSEEYLDVGLIPLNLKGDRPPIELLMNNFFYCFPETAQDIHRLSGLPFGVQVSVIISDKLGSSHSLLNAVLSIQTANRWTGTSIKQVAFRTIRGTTDEENKDRYIAVLESRRYVDSNDNESLKALYQRGELITVDEIRGDFANDKGVVGDAMTQLLLSPENNITAPMMPAIGESIINPTLTLIPEGVDYRIMQDPEYDPTAKMTLSLEERQIVSSVLINANIGKVTSGIFGKAYERKQRLLE